MTTESVAPEAVHTPTVDIPATVRRLRETFASGRTRSIDWRKQQLRALERLMLENEPAVAAALGYTDDQSIRALNSLDQRKLLILLVEGNARLLAAGRRLAQQLETTQPGR